MSGQLYLVPNTLGDSPINRNLPQEVITTIETLKYYIVENVRSARRFLKHVNSDINIDELTFFVLDKHTNPNDIPSFLNPIDQGHSIGLLSEAGCVITSYSIHYTKLYEF